MEYPKEPGPHAMTFFKVPEFLTERIEFLLKSKFDLTLNNSQKLANCIKKMSGYYMDNAWASTPWQQDWCQIAQISYYLPLNFLRIQAALTRPTITTDSSLDHTQRLFDFGAGLSPTAWYFYQNHPDCEMTLDDISPIPLSLLQSAGLKFNRSPIEKSQKILSDRHSLLSCSYLLTEIETSKDLKWVKEAGNLLFIEPSLQTDGRRLMQWRSDLINLGYHIVAPCTHQQACPLLLHSKTDWCHDRLHFERPNWLIATEQLLPFENKTLTFCYLRATRHKTNLSGLKQSSTTRVIGDTLYEKGKTKQAVCRSPERTFLTWMHRSHPNPEFLERGQLISLDPRVETKGSAQNLELRIPSDTLLGKASE